MAFEQLIHHSPEKDLPGNANWVVQKYGGTSLGKFPVQIAEDIITPTLEGSRIAVVCSARSTYTKSEGTTNRLLRAAREAEKSGSRKYLDLIKIIREDHINAGNATLTNDPDIAQAHRDSVNEECDSLVKILESAQHLTEVSTRTEDKIVAKGEKLSCLYITALLQNYKIKATFVDFSDILPANDKSATRAVGIDRDLYKRLTELMAARILELCPDSVPVITGYFGNLPGGLLNTVGRGYTDLCAALVAVGLGARELQIWKEVDGIFTADPRKVPTAHLLESVTPSEAAELTFYGSEVIHPFTMDQAISAAIPIRIKNVKNPRNRGTVIWPDPRESARKGSMSDERRPHRILNGSTRRCSISQRPKRPTAVTIKRGITILNVHSRQRTRAHGFLMSIFSILDKHRLSVDLISSSEVNVSMALHTEVAIDTIPGSEEMEIDDEALRGAVYDLGAWGDVDIVPNMAIVSLVGRQLRSMVGVSGRFFRTLGQENINIEMISQGASEINISCVIEAAEADRALNVVHTSMFTFLGE